MTRHFKVWMVVAVLFTIVNLAGAVMAAAQGELLHAGLHVGLLLLGAYIGRAIWRRGKSVISALTAEFNDSLTRLEQSLDALAIEIDRVSEGQQFITRLFTEKGVPQTLGESAAEPSRDAAASIARAVRDAIA